MIVIEIGYKSLVIPTEDAIRLAEILARAEMYEEKYIPSQQRKDSDSDMDYNYYVYPQKSDAMFKMKIISDSLYQMAKLAGEPTKG
jgi:hypothetical protein